MKTVKLFLSMVLLMTMGNTFADNLSVADFSIAPGETKAISIDLTNPDREYIMVEFWMSLPEGISIPQDEDGYYLAEGNASRFQRSHSLEVNYQGGFYHFLVFSSRNDALRGSSGELISFTVEVASDVQEGTYVAKIFNQLYNDTDKNEVTPNDVPFNITVESSDGRIHFDETDTSLPTYTAGEKGDVTMKRTIKAGEWNTIVLPFTLTKAKAEAAFGSDVELAEFTGFETEYADEEDITPDAITINFATYTMSAKKGMTGGKPFLIKTSSDIESFEADDVTLFSVVTDVTKADEYDTTGKFTGSLVKTVVPMDGLFLSENKFWYSTGNTNIKAFRCWFLLDAVLDKETDFGTNVNFVVDGDPASVYGVPFVLQSGNVYTIQGQYVGHGVDMEQLPKGVYIVDGKKVLIK